MGGMNHGSAAKNRRDFFAETSTLRHGLNDMLPKAASSWTLEEAAHLLNRAGFGGNPAEIRALHALGRERAVDSMIKAEDPQPPQRACHPQPPPVGRRTQNGFRQNREIQRRGHHRSDLPTGTARRLHGV
jgi:hypothetical protein